MGIDNKTILVTGAVGGIGSVVAKLLATNGASVGLLDFDEKGGIALEQDLRKEGLDVWFQKIDVTNEEDWHSVVSTALERTGRIDVVVNNAGINIRKPIEEMVMDEWAKMMAVNVGSIFLSAKAAIPVMRTQGSGLFINMSSICGLIGHKYTPEAYTASKGAVTLLTKSISSRYAKDGIRANSIHPSTVDTPMVQQMFKDPQKKRERLDEVPLGRLGTVDDVAQAVLFLASDEASFLNGIALPVDGGLTAC
ncbi:MAG: cyclopentanol dehydrogenase [Spirochaetes bacterium GWC2_52_13]|nr:MAG: cyclopentanol dehydrogenase [Spirochaetes bacterium GWC2_52_13]